MELGGQRVGGKLEVRGHLGAILGPSWSQLPWQKKIEKPMCFGHFGKAMFTNAVFYNGFSTFLLKWCLGLLGSILGPSWVHLGTVLGANFVNIKTMENHWFFLNSFRSRPSKSLNSMICLILLQKRHLQDKLELSSGCLGAVLTFWKQVRDKLEVRWPKVAKTYEKP